MKTYLKSLSLLVLLLTSISLAGQNTIPPSRLGFYGGLNFNFSDVEILGYQHTQAPPHPEFNSLRLSNAVSTYSGSLGLLLATPLTDMLHLSGRLGFSRVTTDASSPALQLPVSGPTSGYQANLTGGVSYIEISPVFEIYNLINGVSLHPIVGVEFGVPISTTRGQKVTETPLQGGIPNDIPGHQSSEIADAGLRTALILGLGYTFKLSNRFYLQPEASYRVALSDVSSATADAPWTVSQARIGINLFFDISSSKKDPLPDIAKPAFRIGVDRITAFEPDGREVSVDEVVLEDVRYTELFPLVPYLFFPENSATPDSRQQILVNREERGRFSIQGLSLDALEINKHTLNIIGQRMEQYQNATLTITGANDGKSEVRSKTLSTTRADFAKSYLTSNYSIDPTRITTVNRNLPEKPSSNQDPEGTSENRRVEFRSSVPDVTGPIVLTADNQRIARPDAVRFHTKVEGRDDVENWTLTLSQAGKQLRKLDGIGKPEAISWTIRPNDLSNQQIPIDYELIMMSNDGESASTSGSVPVEYLSSTRKRTENLPDKTIDRYSLILFDFDKAEITPENRRILEQLVLPNIASNSRVSIMGHTDRIGTEDHNKKLSIQRAESIRSFLSSRAGDASYTTTGLGETLELFNNSLDAGRHLSRTVRITVETPRK